MESDSYPMHPVERLQNAPRCTAHSKRTGLPCRAPAVRGWKVCRMHGARGGAPCGEAHGNYLHGARSSDVLEIRRLASKLNREARLLAETIDAPS